MAGAPVDAPISRGLGGRSGPGKINPMKLKITDSLSSFCRIERTTESETGGARARAAVDGLYAVGAIANLSGEPRPILIGDLQWLEGPEFIIFTAYGDGPSDAHLVRFDEVIVNEQGSITFLSAGHVVGAIHRIGDADVDDTDDYRIAWQLWQDVAPVHQPMIQRCYQTLRRSRRN